MHKMIIFFVTVLFLIGAFGYLLFQNITLMQEKIHLEFVIKEQNAHIKRQELDLQNYICDLETMQDYAHAQYKRAFEKTKDDSTCEAKLLHLENILQSYED